MSDATIITPPGNPPPQTPLADLNLKPSQAPANPAAPAASVPTPAPAAQPVTQDALKQLIESLQKPAQGAVPQSFAPTGDDLLDGMVESVVIAFPNLHIDRAVGRAISEGDARFIDEAYIREIAGDRAEKVLKVARAAIGHINAEAAAVSNAVNAAAGGQEKWAAAVAAFNQNAAPELRKAVAGMADNPKTAVAAAQVVLQFASANGFSSATNLSGNPSFSAPGQSSGLSSAEFKAEMQKLNQSAGRTADYQEKRADLYNRRVLGKQAGLN